MVTVLTRTIGPSGRDYASFTLAEADVTNIGTSADLVANDEAIVFEADAGTYTSSFVTFQSTLTTDATRNVTYRPAAGSEHGGSLTSGVVLDAQLFLNDSHMNFVGIVSSGSTSLFYVGSNTEGVIVDGCVVYNATANNVVNLQGSGSSSSPTIVRNCVAYGNGVSSGRVFDVSTYSGDIYCSVYNCTIIPNGSWPFFYGGSASNTWVVELVNNLILGGSTDLVGSWTSPTATTTGSNNFGPGPNFVTVGIEGAPYPITASTAYDPGAGDFALYVGKNGALLDSPNNDVIGGGVGPSVNSDVPTTDILGNPRSGATANPGAFEVPQATATLTRTIGPVGRDYASFTLAEADVTNIGGSADLVNENERIVFEADAGTYSESVTFSSSLTTDATRQVTYKPASGSEHGGVFQSGVNLQGTIGGIDDFTQFIGLSSSSSTNAVYMGGGDGVVFDGVIFGPASSTGGNVQVRINSTGVILQNCVLNDTGSWTFYASTSSSSAIEIYNCTFFSSAACIIDGLPSGSTMALTNNLFLSGTSARLDNANTTTSGSNNFATATLEPVAIQGSPYPITATTSFSTPLGSGDYAVYMGATGALANVTGNDVWQQGVGPASNSDVPTTDINGVARSGATCNPGAFEADGFVAPTVVTKTIGPSGRDYASVILAEADVENLATSELGSTDLTYHNGRIEFTIDSATYSGLLSLNDSLVKDATRQVTYKAATPHLGVFGVGPVLTNTATACAYVSTDYCALFDLEFKAPTATNVAGLRFQTAGKAGTLVRNMLYNGADTGAGILSVAVFSPYGSGTALEPHVFENCVFRGGLNISAGSADSNFSITNCTSVHHPDITPNANQRMFSLSATSPYTQNSEIVNVWTAFGRPYTAYGTGTNTVTGSNNFGGSTDPFPAALQGSPYPITASTAYDPGAGDFALYVGKNGALLDSPNNDVIDQGVGPSANSDVPTTDILGNARSGATANPGAFEQPQATATITKTIGPAGRDYTTFTLAEADVTNIGGSADLVNENERIVFEADAGTYNETVAFSSTLTTDATRNVTYKSASGSEHGGDPESGPIIQNATAATAVLMLYDHYTAFDGLVVKKIAPGSNRSIRTMSAATDGIVFRNLIVENTGTSTQRAFEVQGSGILYENIVVTDTGDAFRYLSGTGQSHTHINCTIISATYGYYNATGGGTIEVVNALNLGVTRDYSFSGGWTVTGTNNFGSATSFQFPVALQGSPYPITATTNTDPGAGDWAIYETATGTLVFDSDNDVLLGGIGPDSNSDVPTTDIVGTTRSGGTTDPGAFQVSPAGIGAFGIETEEAFGSPTLDTTITVTAGRGIVSAEAFGTALIAGADLVVTGIASAEVFGRPALEAGTQFRLEFQPDSTVVDVMTHVDAPLTTLTGQDRPIPGMVHTTNYYAQHLGWSSDQTAANDEPSPYGGDKITVIVPPPRGDGATP